MEGPFCAIGSGRDFALAAMALGHSAIEAVTVAGRFDTASGNGFDALPLTANVVPIGVAA